MKITIEELTPSELLKIAKVLTAEEGEKEASISGEAFEEVSDTDDVQIDEPRIDKEGLPWDARIHSSNHKLTSNGIWQRRRGISDEEYNRIKDELHSQMALINSAVSEPVTTLSPAGYNNTFTGAVTPVAPQASQASMSPAAPVTPQVIPQTLAVDNSFVPMTSAAPVMPQAMPDEDEPEPEIAPIPSIIPQPSATPVAPTPVADDPEVLYQRMFEQLRNGLQMKVLDANFMQNVIANVNATYGTSYKGAAELRGNSQALSFVINELVKKGL